MTSLFRLQLARVLGRALVVTATLAFSALPAAIPSLAQDASSSAAADTSSAAAPDASSLIVPAAMPGDAARGKIAYGGKGGCVYCHGWAGDGTGSNPRHEGAVANLRQTALDDTGLREAIRCGRPGSPMPSHDNQAYVDARCYGMVAADFNPPTSKPPKGPSLTEQQMADISAYILQHFVPLAQTKVTLKECEEFFKPGARVCQGLPN